jgi:tetratricopeptide (TPR) repeat protein
MPAEDWAVVQRLADRRLVVTDRDPGERETERETAQVAHEALIAGWARLRDWVAADRDFLSWREQVRAAVRLWEASHRDESDLLRGKRLADAERWCSDRAREVDERVVEFVRESRRGEAGELMVRAGDSLHHGMRAEAIAGYERASAILQELGDRKRQLSVLDEIIRLHLKAGEPERAEAIAGYERASAILQELGDRKRQLKVLRTLVRLHLKADAPQLAMHRYREILELLGPEARSNETTLMLSLIAQIAAQRKEDPLPWYLEALTTHREVGERHGEAETESRLANLYLRKRKVDQALRHAAGALRLYRERGEQRPVDSLLWTLLWTQGLRGETVAATRCYWEMARLGQAELAAELTNMTRWYHKWFFKLSVRLVLTLLAFLVVSGPLIWFASYGIGIAALDRIFAHRYHAFGTTIGFGVDVRWVSRTVVALGAVALAWMVGGGLMRVLLATVALLTLCEGWLWLLDASGHNLLLQALSVTFSVLLLRWLVLRTRWTLIRPYTRKLRVAARWVRHATVDRWIAEEATFWEPSASPALLPPAHRRDR